MADRERIIQLFFFAFFVLMAYELFALLSPFLVPIAWALLLAFMVHPAQLELRKHVKNRTLTAAIITFVVATLVILPASWLSEKLAIESQTLYAGTANFIKNDGLQNLNVWVQHSRFGSLFARFGFERFDITKDLPKLLSSGEFASQFLIKNATSAAKNVVSIVIDFGIVLMTFFYLVRDGESYYDELRQATPLHEEDKDAIFDTLRTTMAAVIRGLLLTAIIQGVAIGLGLLVVGIPYWVVLSLIAGVCGLLPLGGTAIVWIPAAGYLFYERGWQSALVLVIWCSIAVAVIDNFFKPIVMRHGTKLPTLALFFGIAGGLELYGPIGIFVGPAIIAIFASLLQMFRQNYGNEHKPQRRARP